MNPEKDYYAILGLLPSAEAFLVRAAYKALSQKYHPDKSSGDASRMTEINEAYNVLSDPSLRAKYDSARNERYRDNPTPNDFDSGQDPRPDSFSSDWITAEKFYPDLTLTVKHLRKFSWRLSSSYQALLLETKEFQNRSQIAKHLEDGFLKQYFGRNENVVNFARDLVLSGNKAAAKDLNNAIRVVGDADANRIISTVKQIHGLTLDRADQLTKLLKTDTATINDLCELVELFGGSAKPDGVFNNRFIVTYQSSKLSVNGYIELKNWITSNIFQNLE